LHDEIDVLLSRHWPVMVGRSRAKLRGHPDADDVAQNVALRLVHDWHKRGGDYGDLPYEVVVANVIRWTVGDYFQNRRIDVPLEEERVVDFSDEVVAQLGLEQLLAGIGGKDGEVGKMRYVQGLEPDEIAQALEMKRNAVDQALWRVRKKLREEFGGT
jgi:RNA polymerase sigma factor (sigma-70 family)